MFWSTWKVGTPRVNSRSGPFETGDVAANTSERGPSYVTEMFQGDSVGIGIVAATMPRVQSNAISDSAVTVRFTAREQARKTYGPVPPYVGGNAKQGTDVSETS